MSIWIWVLFGFVAGLVVAEILYLVLRRGSPPELEDDTPAQLAQEQAKTAVLEDKLRAEEDARAQLRADLEAENQEKLEAASAEYGERLTAAEAGYSQKLETAESQYQENLAAAEAQSLAMLTAASAEYGERLTLAEADYSQRLETAETQYQENMEMAEVECQAKLKSAEDLYRGKLALLKLQFDNLQLAFAAAELPDADEVPFSAETGPSAGAALTGAATAVAVGALAGDEGPDATLDEIAPASEEAESGDGVGERRLPGTATLAAAAAAVLAADEDEAGDADVEPDNALMDAEQEIDELLSADVEATLSEEGVAMSLAELERSEAARFEQASAAVQYAYDLQDEAETATRRADDHVVAIMMAALAARAAAAEVQEEEAAIGEASLIVEPPTDETAVTEADEAKVEAVGENSAVPQFVAQETAEADLEETAVEAPAGPEDSSTWRGEYFNNMTLEGEPVMVREDAEIDFDWGMGSPAPAIDDDGFSVRWTRTANLRRGLYRFTVTSDDGARLWINERLVISAWYDHTEMTFRREMELPGGPVEFRLEYYEKSMLAMVRASWEKIG